MRIALVMNDNSYPGREYISAMVKNRIEVDAIVLGTFPRFNEREYKRCGGLWNPPTVEKNLPESNIYRFSSLKDKELKEFLAKKAYDIGIQGGTGILRSEIYGAFRLGMLNFHPGDLPKYRGCSAPEWQIWEGNPVISTCHVVDSGIDSGDVIDKREIYRIGEGSYYEMRSQVYPRTSLFVVDVVHHIEKVGVIKATKQDENKACYRKYIGERAIEELIIKMEKEKSQ